MQFKHPELLYALLLLIIPIIVHFFQLRKFRKEAFTNVKFLKKVEIQARKSSQLKKWLVLLSRLLALAAIIIAFAQPFIPQSNSALKTSETVIYLDNSFSMQLRGEKGELLKSAAQDLLKSLPGDENISLFTNNSVFRNVSKSALKKELLALEYTAENNSLKTNYLKALNLFSADESTEKNFIGISDFQQKNLEEKPDFKAGIDNQLIQLSPNKTDNLSIDSIFVSEKDLQITRLRVQLSSNKLSDKAFPVALRDGDSLLAKSSISFPEKKEGSVEFSVSAKNLNAKVSIDDQGLRYDNQFYFSLQQPDQIKVVVINGGDADFLKKIFADQNEFSTKIFSEKELNYNALSNANFVILNELQEIPNGLANLLNDHLKNNNSLTIIPAKNADSKAYQAFFQELNIPPFQPINEQEMKVTQINFAHPLYENVFNDQVSNFDYPTVQSYFSLTQIGSHVLSYANKEAFLLQKNNMYLFTAPLHSDNSNFKNSPLIVPSFYNMALQSLQLPQLYYELGKTNQIDLNLDLKPDEVVHLKNETEDFIPQQQKFNHKLVLTTDELPKTAGIYAVTTQNKSVKNLSFNYNRDESKLSYANLSGIKNVELNENIEQFFTKNQQQREIHEFWKWFVIFALFFLVVEMLLLKLLK